MLLFRIQVIVVFILSGNLTGELISFVHSFKICWVPITASHQGKKEESETDPIQRRMISSMLLGILYSAAICLDIVYPLLDWELLDDQRFLDFPTLQIRDWRHSKIKLGHLLTLL